MTPSQMVKPRLEQSPPAPPPAPGPLPDTRNFCDHVLQVQGLPANPGHTAKRTSVEPWVLEQFNNGACPTCGEHLIHLVNAQHGPGFDFYLCESDKTHRWTLTEG
jgi:hypothetical protein